MESVRDRLGMVIRHGDVLVQEAEAAWCRELLYLQHDVDGVQEQAAPLAVMPLAMDNDGEVLTRRSCYPYDGGVGVGVRLVDQGRCGVGVVVDDVASALIPWRVMFLDVVARPVDFPRHRRSGVPNS